MGEIETYSRGRYHILERGRLQAARRGKVSADLGGRGQRKAGNCVVWIDWTWQGKIALAEWERGRGRDMMEREVPTHREEDGEDDFDNTCSSYSNNISNPLKTMSVGGSHPCPKDSMEE